MGDGCLHQFTPFLMRMLYTAKWLLHSLTNRAMVCCLNQAETVEERIESLNDVFTYAVYVNVVRSLFEVHKLMFAFKMACNILRTAGAMQPREPSHLLNDSLNFSPPQLGQLRLTLMWI